MFTKFALLNSIIKYSIIEYSQLPNILIHNSSTHLNKKGI